VTSFVICFTPDGEFNAEIFQNDIKEWKFEDLEKEVKEETNISNSLYLRQYSWKTY
jgi:hypothetical protein